MVRSRRLAVAAIAACACAVVAIGGCAVGRQTRERNHRLVRIYTQLAAGFYQRNQIVFARQEIRKALAINPDDSDANNVMALVQARMKHYRRAGKYFARAVRNRPGNAAAQNDYGVFLCERGHVRKALARFAKAIGNPIYRSPQWANVNAGNCLLRAHQPLQAKPYFAQALKLQPNLGVALYQLSSIDFASGHPHRARAYIRRYFAVAPESPESLFLAVRIEQALGDLDKQATYALRLTSKYPDSRQARELVRLGEHGRL
ncbi:MAG: type IV pilus biogenesis/stability protein PilW [Acidiferrobacteraceae bacterium]